MSNAEKILNEISDLHYDDWQKEDILKAMQAHTNKALSELEEKAEHRCAEIKYVDGRTYIDKEELYTLERKTHRCR